MSDKQHDLLSNLFASWREVADETNRVLGEETAGFFIEIHNDVIDILKAINNAYPQAQWLCSLTCIEFMGLLKEVLWLHAQFLSGNYPIVLGRLRFNWERIFRAHYADNYAQEPPDENDVPGPTLDDKHEWLKRREENGGLNWRSVIAPTLNRLFLPSTPEEVRDYFKPLWDRLNRCVHPSGDLREKLTGESALHLLDDFDEGWAQETRRDAVEVFGLIFLAVLSWFPDAVPALLADPNVFCECPQLRAYLQCAASK